MYLYNPNRHTLHIKDYCPHSKGFCPSYLQFETENEAIAYGGRSVGLCKLCQQRRERNLAERKEE